jgi:hypothetical protein
MVQQTSPRTKSTNAVLLAPERQEEGRQNRYKTGVGGEDRSDSELLNIGRPPDSVKKELELEERSNS